MDHESLERALRDARAVLDADSAAAAAMQQRVKDALFRTHMQLINLTSNRICLADDSGQITLTLEPSGEIAQIEHRRPQQIYDLTSVPVPVCAHRAPSDGWLVGLPPAQEGVAYLVPVECLEAAGRLRRYDVFAPDTGPGSGCLRDGDGQILAVRRLIAAYIQVYR